MPNFINIVDRLSAKDTLARSGIFGRGAFGNLPLRVVPTFSWYRKYYCTRLLCPQDIFPDYIEGLGYLFHSSHVGCLFKSAMASNFMPFEDVFVTGILGDKCKLERIDIPYFA